MRVGLVGVFGIGNIGNEATLSAALDLVRQLGATPVVICDDPERVGADYQVETSPLYHRSSRRGLVGRIWSKITDLREIVDTTRGLDAVMIPGTGIFEGLWIHAGGVPLSLFWVSLACRLTRRRLITLSVGVDDAASPAARFLLKATLQTSNYLSVRDHGSRRCAADLGVRPVPPVFPDLVFGSVHHQDRFDRTDGDRRTVAVGVMDFNGWSNDAEAGRAERKTYRDRMVALIDTLLGDGLAVRVVVGALPDSSIAAEIVELVRASRPDSHVSRPEIIDLPTLVAALDGVEVLVAARFHNVVCALALGIPTVSLGYGPKQVDLMADFGLTEHAFKIDQFDVGVVRQHVSRLLETYDICSRDILQHTEKLRERLRLQDAEVQSLIRQGTRRTRVPVDVEERS